MALQIAYDDLSPSLLLEAAEWYALMLELDDIDALISSSSCPFAFLIGPSRAREVERVLVRSRPLTSQVSFLVSLAIGD